MVTITKLQHSDIPEVAQLEWQNFSEPWSKHAFEESFEQEQYTFFVARLEKKVVGYIGVYFVADEGNVTTFAVDEALRRKHIGRKLMEHLFLECRKKQISTLFLEVRRSNTLAQAFYRALGFKADGIRKFFYDKPREDAVLMSRMIEQKYEDK